MTYGQLATICLCGDLLIIIAYDSQGWLLIDIKCFQFKEEKHHGNGSKEQHVGNLYAEHSEQKL